MKLYLFDCVPRKVKNPPSSHFFFHSKAAEIHRSCPMKPAGIWTPGKTSWFWLFTVTLVSQWNERAHCQEHWFCNPQPTLFLSLCGATTPQLLWSRLLVRPRPFSLDVSPFDIWAFTVWFWGQGLPILPHGPAQDELRESWRRSFHVAGEAASLVWAVVSPFFLKKGKAISYSLSHVIFLWPVVT